MADFEIIHFDDRFDDSYAHTYIDDDYGAEKLIS